MNKLIPITLIFLAASLSAQESEQQPPAIDPVVDPIDAEVFADDMLGPETNAPTGLLEQPLELPPEATPEAPSDEQTVPVAESSLDAESIDEESIDDVSAVQTGRNQLPPEATAEEELAWQYHRYLELMRDGVHDEADSVAKRVVELALEVKGPKSADFSKALTNLAIVQHRTGQFDAAQQNFASAIEIIEGYADRLNGDLINPLKGLGAAQLEIGRPDLANDTFSRAVHVSHVNDGPHNLEQIGILESLAETNLRLGSLEDARMSQDMIYALNERAYASNAVGMLPSLMRRADWQLRAGFINDQRVTLRRAIRIIEVTAGVNDIRLVDALTRLGQSYFYVDTSSTQPIAQNSMISGEIYFKRAMRIATESPESDWQLIADTSLSLGDYYMFQGNEQRARKVYKEAWRNLSTDEDQLTYRADKLERVVALRENAIQRYISPPVKDATTGESIPMQQGNISIAYEVSPRGRATNLKIIESQPTGFSDMERLVQRALRGRIFRPRFVDAEPVTTDGQVLIHRFYYQQADLDAVNGKSTAAEASPAAESGKT